jgi:hypothetical protein
MSKILIAVSVLIVLARTHLTSANPNLVLAGALIAGTAAFLCLATAKSFGTSMCGALVFLLAQASPPFKSVVT